VRAIKSRKYRDDFLAKNSRIQRKWPKTTELLQLPAFLFQWWRCCFFPEFFSFLQYCISFINGVSPLMSPPGSQPAKKLDYNHWNGWMHFRFTNPKLPLCKPTNMMFTEVEPRLAASQPNCLRSKVHKHPARRSKVRFAEKVDTVEIERYDEEWKHAEAWLQVCGDALLQPCSHSFNVEQCLTRPPTFLLYRVEAIVRPLDRVLAWFL